MYAPFVQQVRASYHHCNLIIITNIFYNNIGQFSNTPASTSCTEAPTGSYSAQYQPTESFLCPIGSYSDTPASQYCTLCPLGKTTMEAGSTSSDDCITCSIGVDAQSYSCLSEGQSISDLCWDRAQVRKMGIKIIKSNFCSYYHSIIPLEYMTFTT